MKEDVFKVAENLRKEFESKPENFKFREFVAASQSEVLIIVKEGTFNSSQELNKAIEEVKSKHGSNIKIVFASEPVDSLAEVAAKFEASVEESIKIREMMKAPEVFLTEKPKHPFQKFIGKPKY